MSYRIQEEDGTWGEWSKPCFEYGDVVTVVGPYSQVMVLVMRHPELKRISQMLPEDIYVRGIIHKGIKR